MPHTTDLDVTPKEIVGLASADAISAFLARLGYETDDRAVLSPEAVGLAGESASAIKKIELLSEDPEQFLRVVFAQPKSLTAKVRNDLVRVLGRSTLDHLLVLASDFDTLEFVFLDKRKREQICKGESEYGKSGDAQLLSRDPGLRGPRAARSPEVTSGPLSNKREPTYVQVPADSRLCVGDGRRAGRFRGSSGRCWQHFVASLHDCRQPIRLALQRIANRCTALHATVATMQRTLKAWPVPPETARSTNGKPDGRPAVTLAVAGARRYTDKSNSIAERRAADE